MQGMQVVEYNVHTFHCHYSVPSFECIPKFSAASKSIGLLKWTISKGSVWSMALQNLMGETLKPFDVLLFPGLTRSVAIWIAGVECDFACKEKPGVLSSGRLCVVCGACDPIPCLQGPGKSSWNDSVEWAVKVTARNNSHFDGIQPAFPLLVGSHLRSTGSQLVESILISCMASIIHTSISFSLVGAMASTREKYPTAAKSTQRQPVFSTGHLTGEGIHEPPQMVADAHADAQIAYDPCGEHPLWVSWKSRANSMTGVPKV